MNQQITCPKCGVEQERSEQCENCEIYFEKYYQAMEQQQLQDRQAGERSNTLAAKNQTNRDALADETGSLNIIAIGGAAFVAFVGAWLWMIIAVKFEYEFGLIAWLIGGAVGFASAALGGRGLLSGVLCALLALGAILGGGYWTYEQYKADAVAQFSILEDDLEMADDYFDEIVEDARLYRSVGQDDHSLSTFMVERGYTETENPASVGSDEIADFKEFSGPDLEWISANNPSFEQWNEYTMRSVTSISSWSLIKESFDFFSALFLFLGVTTAFKLGYGGTE